MYSTIYESTNPCWRHRNPAKQKPNREATDNKQCTTKTSRVMSLCTWVQQIHCSVPFIKHTIIGTRVFYSVPFRSSSYCIGYVTRGSHCSVLLCYPRSVSIPKFKVLSTGVGDHTVLFCYAVLPIRCLQLRSSVYGAGYKSRGTGSGVCLMNG